MKCDTNEIKTCVDVAIEDTLDRRFICCVIEEKSGEKLGGSWAEVGRSVGARPEVQSPRGDLFDAAWLATLICRRCWDHGLIRNRVTETAIERRHKQISTPE